MIQPASLRKPNSMTISPSSRASKRQMSEPFTLASSLGGVGWCDRTSSFCSWWHGEGGGRSTFGRSSCRS
ncbi:hypothetical protein DL95DRAFT_398501 [Leptodontidium sp. 2 PMI_412]|nr:hypothetical protein DL95DRAFT_398501 [Leptodontidium sp. 2 PMI_412]